MIVIAKRNNGKLIKDYKYEVLWLKNSGKNTWGEGLISIKDIGTYKVDYFTDIDGNPIQNIDIIIEHTKSLEFKDLKKGDILVCKRDNYKSLLPGNMYKIVELKTTKKDIIGWNGQPQIQVKEFIKLEGHRFIQFNSWCFRKLSTSEAREINLKSVLDGEVDNYVVDTSIRKIDMVSNKDLELMKIISKSIIDYKRHHLGIVDWACEKVNHRMDITKDDFEVLLNMSLKDILEKIKQD